MAGLTFAVFCGWLLAAGRLYRALRKKKESPEQSRKILKYLALLSVILLPGGLVGGAALAFILGKNSWRADAARIFIFSLLPGSFLVWAHWPGLASPFWRESIWTAGLAGIVFAFLQIWILLKLTRQTWGEPEFATPVYPPLALWLQSLLWLDLVLLLTLSVDRIKT